MGLSTEVLLGVYGGKITASKTSTIAIIIGIVTTFIIGVIDGFKRPLGCNR